MVFLSRYLQDHPIRRPVQACHAALLLFQKWPVALPSDGKWKLPRLPKEGHGQSKEIFLCSAADPGLLDKGTPPPMRFEKLMDSQLPDYLKETVKSLLDLKMNSPEVKEIPRIDILNGYLDESIDEVKALVEQYPREVVKDWDELNRLFLRALEM